MLNFWATWCAPCVKEMPQLDRFHREYAARGWQVVGLAIDPRRRCASSSAGAGQLSDRRWPASKALDLSQRARQRRGGLPFTVVFDQPRRARAAASSAKPSFDELARWAAAGLSQRISVHNYGYCR